MSQQAAFKIVLGGRCRVLAADESIATSATGSPPASLCSARWGRARSCSEPDRGSDRRAWANMADIEDGASHGETVDDPELCDEAVLGEGWPDTDDELTFAEHPQHGSDSPRLQRGAASTGPTPAGAGDELASFPDISQEACGISRPKIGDMAASSGDVGTGGARWQDSNGDSVPEQAGAGGGVGQHAAAEERNVSKKRGIKDSTKLVAAVPDVMRGVTHDAEASGAQSVEDLGEKYDNTGFRFYVLMAVVLIFGFGVLFGMILMVFVGYRLRGHDFLVFLLVGRPVDFAKAGEEEREPRGAEIVHIERVEKGVQVDERFVPC